jgi:hypothetical protein
MRKQYGWGVRGWGASQNNPQKALIKSASLYLRADQPDGQPFVKLEPRTLPNGVSNGELTPQNVSGDVVLQASDITAIIVGTNVTQATIPISVLNGIIGAGVSDTIATKVHSSNSLPLNGVTADSTEGIGRHYLTGSTFRIILPLNTTLEQARTLLAGTVIRYQLATPIDTLNVPFKNPWTDLKGTADCTLVNFAGTTADGYTVETINGKTNTFLNLDGLNSFGQFANMDVLNPVGTDDFAQMVVFRPDDLSTRYWGIGRNSLSTTADQQFALATTTSAYVYVVNGSPINTIPVSLSLSYLLYGRINGRRFLFVNDLEVSELEYTDSITTKPNTQLGCRSFSIDGLSKTQFAKGLQGDIAFWKGAQGTLDKDKIVDLVKKAMKSKYGLGV